MFNIGMDADKFGKVGNVIDAVSVTINSDVHVNDLVKASNTLITGEFVLHMSSAAVSEPLKFGHMYDWGMVGNPQGRLWKHILRGRGRTRQLSFDFKASTKAVPVAPRLSAIGVKNNHIFTWKAPVMELGLPVRISPVLAQALVFEAKEVKRGASSTGTSYASDGIVFHKGTIAISKAGPAEAWGAFTNEFNSWFRSGMPEQIIKTQLAPIIDQTIRTAVAGKLKSIGGLKTKPKTFTLEPVGVDKSFAATLANSLRANYIAGAALRRGMVQDDYEV